MAEWKKVVVSGSNVSQLNNDAGYLTSGTLGQVNGFATASVNGTLILADSPTGSLAFASSSGAGLNISGNAGTDTITFTLGSIPNTSLTNSSITIAGNATALGGSVTQAQILNASGVYSSSAQLPAGLVSSSALNTSATQGTVVNVINGVSQSAALLNLGTTGTPTFGGVTITNGNIAINNSTSTAITTTGTTAAVFNTSATTVNAFGAATTLSIGAGSGTTTINNSAVITGDLTVNGTTTYINTTDLYVEDKFILLASGSATAGDGGIIIDRGSDAAGNIAFGYDSTTDRWGYQNGLTDSTNAIVIGTDGNSAFAGYVFTEAAHTSTKPTTGEFVAAGAIYTNTDGTIWMYA